MTTPKMTIRHRTESIHGLTHTGIIATIPLHEDDTIVDQIMIYTCHWDDGTLPDSINIAITRKDTDPEHQTTYQDSAHIRLPIEAAQRLCNEMQTIINHAKEPTK